MVDFRINVIVDARNAATNITIIEKRFYGLQRRLFSIYSLLGRFGPALAGVFTFRAIQEQLDGYTALQNRLKAVTREGESLAKVNEDLLQVANRSRSSLTEVGRIYSRLSVSSKQLGISQAELIDFTESLAKTIAISGATSYEAQGALTQFSQALAATALRGDELRSVLEQLPEVSNIIAKRFGVSSGELAKLGEQGLITSKQIIAAFRDSREEIEERFGKTVPTISQSFTVLRNQILVTLGELDRGSGFTANFSKAVLFVAKNIDVVVQALGNLAIFLGPRYVLGAIVKLGAVVRANPLGLILTAASLLIAIVPDFQKAFDELTASVRRFYKELTGFDPADFNLGEFIQSFALSFAEAIDGVVAGVIGLGEVFVEFYYTFQTQPKVAGELLLKGLRDGIEALLDFVLASFQTIGDIITGTFRGIVDVVSNALEAARQLIAGNLEVAENFSQLAIGAASRTLNVYATIPGTFKKNLNALRDAELLPTVELSEDALVAGQRMGEAFTRGVEEYGTPARDAISKLFEVNKTIVQQLGLDAAIAFGSGVMLYKDQSQENIQTALFGPTRFPAMVEQNPLFVPQKKGFGPRPDQPAGADVALPPQGLAANLAAAGKGVEDPYAKSLESLKATVAIEATRLTQGDLIAAQLEARYEIEREVGALTQQQVAELDKFVQLSRDAAALATLADQLDTQKQYIEQERLLNELMRVRPDLINQINDKLVENKIASLEASKALGDGFERAFLKLGQAAQDYASAAEGFVTGFADKASDAITEFVLTGKGSFREFASAILADIVRIIIKLLVLQAIQAAVGVATGGTSLAVGAAVGAGASAAGGGGQRAAGGTVQPDRSYLVGEKGPEIFQPNKTGTIIPNGQPAAPPQVNVQVVNVEDPKKIPQAISGGGADEAILNVLSRRRDAVKRTLG